MSERELENKCLKSSGFCAGAEEPPAEPAAVADGREKKPPLASRELEEKMEDQGVPESDRDEMRRFSEFLALRKNKGKLTAEMRAWLVGKDFQPKRTPGA